CRSARWHAAPGRIRRCPRSAHQGVAVFACHLVHQGGIVMLPGVEIPAEEIPVSAQQMPKETSLAPQPAHSAPPGAQVELAIPAQHAQGAYGHIPQEEEGDRKSTRLNSSHVKISYAVFCLKKKKEDRRR